MNTPPRPAAAAPPPPAPVPVPRRWARDDQFAWLLGAMVWALVVLMIVPENFNYQALVESGSAPMAGGAFSRLQWLSLMGLGGMLLLWRINMAALLTRWLNPFLLLFALLALLSVGWSIEPTLTLRRLIRLFTILAVSIAFVLAAWHPRRFQAVLRPILTLMLGGSLLFGLLAPGLAIHQEPSVELLGAWRGLTNHKNTLGALSSLGMLFWMHAWLAREARGFAALCGLAISGACLLLSHSSTSLVTTIFVLLFLMLMLRGPQMLRRYLPLAVTLFALLLLVYSIAVLRLVPHMDRLLVPVTALTGKDLSFTGRSDIWAILIEHIRFSPWFGSGYAAYWIGPLWYSPSYEMVRKLSFYPGSAHNGYLEIVNDLGAVGLACLLCYLVTYLAHALRLLQVDRSQAALYLALFMQQAISNLSESHWLSVTTLAFPLMTLATAALARSALELRLRHYYGEPGLEHPPARRRRRLGWSGT